MTQTVGKVYAEALYQLSEELHQEQQVYEALNQVADVMAAYPDFVQLLDMPTLDTEERLSILRKLTGTEDGILENFLCLLVEKRRFSRIAEIREAFNQFYHTAFHIAEVSVVTAVALGDRQRQELILKLGQKLQKHILLREHVDKSLLGGMVLQYGDTRIDNSVRTRMQEFAENA